MVTVLDLLSLSLAFSPSRSLASPVCYEARRSANVPAIISERERLSLSLSLGIQETFSI